MNWITFIWIARYGWLGWLLIGSDGGVVGGARKRAGGRAMDPSLLSQPLAVSSISLSQPDPAPYSTSIASGSGGRAGAMAYPPHLNYSALTNALPSGHPRLGSSQPSQLNFALQVHPSNIPSSHSGVGTRTGATQRAQVDFSAFNNDR